MSCATGPAQVRQVPGATAGTAFAVGEGGVDTDGVLAWLGGSVALVPAGAPTSTDTAPAASAPIATSTSSARVTPAEDRGARGVETVRTAGIAVHDAPPRTWPTPGIASQPTILDVVPDPTVARFGA